MLIKFGSCMLPLHDESMSCASYPLCAWQQEIETRLAGIKKEYGELDTVWFMAGSLFKVRTAFEQMVRG